MSTMKKKTIFASCITLLIVMVSVGVWLPKTQAQSTNAYDVSGYAFSDMPNASDQTSSTTNYNGGRGLGRIEMSGTGYSVKLSPSTGKFSGYAWNDIGGFASFNDVSVPTSCLTDPEGTCTVSGDFVFIAAANADLLTSGGWDGVVKMSDASWNTPVTLGKSIDGVRSMSGFAWGGDVVGWVDFSKVTIAVGCTDSTASNYNENATIDDGSCVPIFIDLCTNIEGQQYVVPPNHTKDPATPGVPGVCIPLCSDGKPAPNGDINQCPGGGTQCPTPAPNPNYPGMIGYNNACSCVGAPGSQCNNIAFCNLTNDPWYNLPPDGTTANNKMCFCPNGDFNKATGACGSCPNPNYPGLGGDYNRSCRCIPRPGEKNDCPAAPVNPKAPIYIET